MKITSQRPLHRFISIMIATAIAWALLFFGFIWPRIQPPIPPPEITRVK